MQPNTCQSCASETRRLELSLRTVQNQYSSLRTQFQQLRGDFKHNLDVLAERDQELHRYDVLKSQDSNSQWAQRCHDENHKEQLKEMHKSMSTLQRELGSLTAQTASIKTQQQEQLQERDDIIDRYKKELGTSLEREKHLEQRIVQMELEWEKNSAKIQSKHYLDHERLIYELTAARDNANAELVETKMKLQELTVLLQCVTKERDLALQGCNTDTGFVTSDEMTALKQQNYRLQTVVSEMRKQMEDLSCTTPSRPAELENNVTKEVEKKDVPHLDPKVTRLNEKIPKFTSVCSCGCVSGEKSLSSQLRSRLKQAALCIARLNRDRQQLIELCNRLRAQVCAAEPLQHSLSNSGKHSVQDSTHNLKTEKEEVSVGSELLQTQYQIESLTLQSSVPHSSRLLQTDRQSAESLPSLSDLWALLDQRPSHELSDAAEDGLEVPPEVISVGSLGPVTGGAQMEVCGVSAPVHKPATVKPPQKKIKMKNTVTSARIRNYNIKD